MKKYAHLSLILLLLSARPYAKEPTAAANAISLERAVSLTLKNSEEIRINEEKKKRIFNTYREVRASAFPQIDAAASLDNYIESPVLYFDLGNGPVSIPLKQEWDTRYGLTLSQILCSFGKVSNAIKIAKKAIELEDLSMNATRNELVFAAKQMYFTMLYTSEALRIAQESYKNANNNKTALKEKFKSGRVSRIDNVKMEADIAARYTVVQQARSAHEEVAVGFNDLLGIDKSSKNALADYFIEDFPVFDKEKLLAEMIANEPTNRIFKANVELNQLLAKNKKADFFPTLAGYFNYSRAGNSEEIHDNMQTETITGLKLNMSIWDSGAKINSYKKTVNDTNIARLEYEKKINEAEVALGATLAKYERLLDVYRASLDAEKLAAESYEITLASFRSGVAGQTVLNDAEIHLTSARMSKLQALFNISTTIAAIERMTGSGANP
ncbi:MAG: TolC family protein [Endomicrobiales bacterium]|nr:TolC family protein [Endomicrobiales bacterium]